MACELLKRQLMLNAVIVKWQVQSRPTGREGSNYFQIRARTKSTSPRPPVRRRKRGGAILSPGVSKTEQTCKSPRGITVVPGSFAFPPRVEAGDWREITRYT